jgi:DNA mismatch endonuclease (patch repair protein)
MISKHGFKTTQYRSQLMSKIHSTNTKSEILLRTELKKLRFKFDVNCRDLPGTPDIVFRKNKVVVFMDGEFWHGYKWEDKKKKIKSNREYWIKKIEANIQRDKKSRRQLRKQGYKVLRFWGHQIKRDIDFCCKKIISTVRQNEKG